MKIDQIKSKFEDSFEFKSSGDESEDENQNVENKEEKGSGEFIYCIHIFRKIKIFGFLSNCSSTYNQCLNNT